MINDQIALWVFDSLVSDGIPRIHAAQLGRAVLVELGRDSKLRQLFIVQVLDTWGQPHAIVSRKARPSAPTLYRFDIAALRLAERKEAVRALAEEAALTS